MVKPKHVCFITCCNHSLNKWMPGYAKWLYVCVRSPGDLLHYMFMMQKDTRKLRFKIMMHTVIRSCTKALHVCVCVCVSLCVCACALASTYVWLQVRISKGCWVFFYHCNHVRTCLWCSQCMCNILNRMLTKLSKQQTFAQYPLTSSTLVTHSKCKTTNQK